MTTRDLLVGEAGPVSPELVLVDATLANRSRERLREPEDTLARIEHEVWLRRLMALERAGAAEPLSEELSARARESATRPRRLLGGGRRVPLLAATAASGMTLALLLGVNVDFRGAPAGADSFETTTAPEPTATPLPDPALPASQPSQSPPSQSPPSQSPPSQSPPSQGQRSRPAQPRNAANRTFAWAPVVDASGYHVELFRGERRIFAIDVSAPSFGLPQSWKHAGRAERLVAGTYRWNVWPVVGGLRQSQATVQAELVVP
jgi:hypothetical protein